MQAILQRKINWQIYGINCKFQTSLRFILDVSVNPSNQICRIEFFLILRYERVYKSRDCSNVAPPMIDWTLYQGTVLILYSNANTYLLD